MTTEQRKAELIKMIAYELIILDQSNERALEAEKKIAMWRAEYDAMQFDPAGRNWAGTQYG